MDISNVCNEIKKKYYEKTFKTSYLTNALHFIDIDIIKNILNEIKYDYAESDEDFDIEPIDNCFWRIYHYIRTFDTAKYCNVYNCNIISTFDTLLYFYSHKRYNGIRTTSIFLLSNLMCNKMSTGVNSFKISDYKIEIDDIIFRNDTFYQVTGVNNKFIKINVLLPIYVCTVHKSGNYYLYKKNTYNEIGQKVQNPTDSYRMYSIEIYKFTDGYLFLKYYLLLYK